MSRLLISEGKLTVLGVFSLGILGALLVYLSLQFIPWRVGKILGLSLGFVVAAIGGFSGQASALELPPPFTKDPLGWRRAKKSYLGRDAKPE